MFDKIIMMGISTIGIDAEKENLAMNTVCQEDFSITVSFEEFPEIAEFLASVRTADDQTMEMLLAELCALEMSQAGWNALDFAAHIELINHSAYSPVILAIQQKKRH